jgi:hypothetical protein
MSFIQLIDYETDRSTEIDNAMRSAMGDDEMSPGFLRLEHARDHDNPRHFTTIVEFASYEAAMSNSGKPETDEMARQLASMCTSGPTYRNLDVQMTMP